MFKEENAKLAACGCGGAAYIVETESGCEGERIKIACKRCGMTLDHTQDFAYSNAGRAAINPSAIELWNDCHKGKYDAGYDEGVMDAWELAQKLHDIVETDEGRIRFGSMGLVLSGFTYQEALEHFEAYEQEIKIGDVVRPKGNTKVEILVVKVYPEEETFNGIQIMPRDNIGGLFSERKLNKYEKTGQHLDIQQILNGIGKE